MKAPQATCSFALCGSDGDGVAAVASFQPFFPGLQQPRPLNLAIVIDCSGSMQGDTIEQAKQALEGPYCIRHHIEKLVEPASPIRSLAS